MSMFSICTDFIPEGKLQENLAEYASAEKKFTAEIGVLFRRFFQCAAQTHIIWAITEWESEKHHNDAAQSIMRKRRDDRFASILFGPNPYFEIFCKEEKELRIGNFDDSLNFVIVASGLINIKARDKFLALRKERTAEMQEKLTWLGTYHNIYNPDQFIAFLGFRDEEAFKQLRQVGDLLLEEYLFTGLRKPLGMSFLAGYNQFICTSFSLTD